MNVPSRDFKGIWIPKEIWLNRSLSYFEKILLAEIHSLDGEDGCFASNEYFCKFFEERERKIQDALAHLKSLGYIYQVSFDGRTRVLKTNLHPKNDKSLFSTSDLSKIDTPALSKIDTPSYIDNKDLEKRTTTRPAAAAVSSKSKPTPASEVLATRLASNPELKKCYEEEKQQQSSDQFHPTKSQLTGNSGQLTSDPVQCKIYPCLMDIDIPQADRVWITRHHQEDVVKNAIEWSTHPQTKISTTLVQAIKWACSKKPQTPKTPEDVESENKRQGLKLLKQITKQPNYLKIEMLNNSIEIIYLGSQKPPEEVKYSEKAFLQQLKSKLYKSGCVFTMN